MIFALEENRSCSTWDFLVGLQNNDEDTFDSLVALLGWSADEGPPWNKEKSRRVSADIFEFKSKAARLLWFYDVNQLIICTHGFMKCPPKVQNREIESAVKARKRYFDYKTK